MKSRSVLSVALIVAAAGLVGCARSAAPPRESEPAADEAAPAPVPAPSPAPDLRATAAAVVRALAARDYAALAELVDPEGGVRFSPYSYVDAASDVVLSRQDLEEVAAGRTLRRDWGNYDGSGRPIELSFRDYVDRFVYDVPYLEQASVAVDRRQGSGSSLDNAAEVYPGARIVEYHLPGQDPEVAGMDWRSLRLVLRQEGGRWVLVGVIHDEWTI